MAEISPQPSPSALRGNPALGRKGKPFLPLAFIFRRAPLLLLLGGGLAALMLFVLLPQVTTVYSTDGLLLIDTSMEITVAGRERNPIPGSIRDFTRTLVQRLTAIDLLAQAVERLKPEEYPSFLNPNDPPQINAFRLRPRVTVKEVPLTYLVSVSISADQPQGLAEVLNHLMQAFLDKNEAEQQGRQRLRINYLTLERGKILRRLEEVEEQLLEPVSGFSEDVVLHPNYTAHISKLDMIQRLYWEAESRRSELHNQLQEAKANRQALTLLDPQALADERVTDNFGINRMELWTYEQTALLRKSIDGLTKNNQDRKNVEERIRAMEEYLFNYKDRVSKAIIEQLREKRLFDLDEVLIRAKHAAESAEEHANYLQGLVRESAREHHQVAQGIFRASGLQFNVDQLRERLKALNNRIDDAEMEAMAPMQIHIDKMAMRPGGPRGTNTKMLAFVSILLGFGSVFSFILVFDLVDNRLRDPRELDSALGGSGADPIPVLEGPEQPPGSFSEVLLHWPGHPAALAIRGLAVRFELEWERHGSRVFVLAGLGPGCGVSSLALGLAQALRAGNRRLLLVETNRLRPGLTRVQGVLRPVPGLWEALKDDNLALETLVQWDLRRQIGILPLGEAGQDLVDRPAFLRFLVRCREHYDLILLDAAPLAEDDFAYYLAAHADAVLLVGREDVSLYRDLRQSIERLVLAGVPAVSAVLNGVRAKRAERIGQVIHAAMRSLSRWHWLLHRSIHRGLRRLAGRGG
jgi:polysaccharide biosynthesis transport protein